MVVRSVIPSTLVRSVQRFASQDSDRDDTRTGSGMHGLLLGYQNSAPSEGEACDTISIWGILRDFSKRDAVLPYVPGGIQVVGTFSLYDGDEQDEEDAAAAIAKEAASAALAAAITQQHQQNTWLSLVYNHKTTHFHLFENNSNSTTMTPVSLDIIDSLRASDFISSTDSLLLRALLAVDVDSIEELQKLLCELEDPNSNCIFFQFPEQRKSIFNQRGVDATASAGAASVPLSALVKIPEKKRGASTTTTTMSKNQKKKANALAANDAWGSTSSKSSGSSGKGSTVDFWRYQEETDDAKETTMSYVKTLEFGDIAHVELSQSLARTSAFGKKLPTSPYLVIPSSASDGTSLQRSVRVLADAIVVVPQSASSAEVVQAIRAEIIKQLHHLERQWAQSDDVEMLASHHFGLPGVTFPLTLPSCNGGHDVASHTSILADALFVPTNQPLFDLPKCSLLHQASFLSKMGVLVNVHEGIPPSGIPHGTQFLVDGFYGYYHYMQQATNDKGWGCAYRSLQTLASWLFLNQYTTKSTLTHREIQETLVKIGDKPSSFLGSRDWIGSMEVGFVLDELFGISFRTLNVSSGPQLVEKAQELKVHFETQGTPVMMGGGSLAFTLLGIDYNASSGECAFLILDPHYTGAEDLETIQTKTMALEGYKAVPCGWRKASSFAKNSFYNLCLPQRPPMEK